MSGDEQRAAKKPKRTYRACYPCRSRKLKCSFGDPNMPWDGPCERCLREQRECLRAKATFVKDAVPRKSDLAEGTVFTTSGGVAAVVDQRRSVPPGGGFPGPPGQLSRPTIGQLHQMHHGRYAPRPHASSFSDQDGAPDAAEGSGSRANGASGSARGSVGSLRGGEMEADPPVLRDDKGAHSSDEEEDDGDAGDNALVSSNLQNPSDALKLLASASSLQYQSLREASQSRLKEQQLQQQKAAQQQHSKRGNNAATWSAWAPIQQGCLTVQDARALFSFFELEMAPLYPIIHPMLFEASYLETLVKQESILLGSILVIAARYSNILANDRGAHVHQQLAQWVRFQLLGVMDGDPSLRSISTVEALLLLSEWPMVPMPRAEDRDYGDDNAADEAVLLKPSLRYEAFAWTNIGWAVRLAQELGIHDAVHLQRIMSTVGKSWKQHRMLKTWVYCYNAERHIAVRQGRNTVLQEAMTTQWWESVSDLVGHDNRGPRGSSDVHTSDVFILSCIAQLMGTIQDHLYPNKEVTRALLRTGAWEPFLRSFRLEIRYSKRSVQYKLRDGSMDSALLQIELDYVVLYANAIALRALQGKLRRRRQVNDVHYSNPSLLNMVEGPWIMEALTAARSIIDVTLNVLEHRQILRYCPSRIFQYILFATTFLYKALASGMVEYGEQSMAVTLDKVVSALNNAAIDEAHFLRGFASLLKRLGKHWQSASANSPSILNRGPASLHPPEQQPMGASPEQPQAAAPEAERVPASAASYPAQRPDSILPSLAHMINTRDIDPSIAELPQFHFDILQPAPGAADFGGGGGGGQLPFSADSVVAHPPEDFNWNFNPTSQMPAAASEQDLLFQSIWDHTQQDSNATSANLYATLLGDVLIGMDQEGA
ncbi:hypothetical protein Q8F55_007385 [Vanrija albida]|uniref:Zn(2)-C6 fungal-type domain-containing protein n=1 Tax=Vanrija albida TaxID=181172 RepID=A0ABR3PTE5_9TREE